MATHKESEWEDGDKIPSLKILCVECLINGEYLKHLNSGIELILTLNATVLMGVDGSGHEGERLLLCRKRLRKYAFERYDILHERFGDAIMQEVLQDEYATAKAEQAARLESTRLLAACRTGQPLPKPQVTGPREDGSIPYTSLIAGVDWPSHVVPSKREQYLSEEEFQKYLGMSKADFNDPEICNRVIRERLKKACSLW